MRLFVAVDLTTELSAVVGELLGELRRIRSAAQAAWTKPENLHFTMQFLGEVEEFRLPALHHALTEAAHAQSAFELQLAGWGVFPNATRPRVVWLGCAEPVAPMIALADGIGRALEPVGFPREARPFHPHLTLARLRQPTLDEAVRRRLDARTRQPLGRMRVEEFHLYESRLHPTGAEYLRKESYRLGR